MPVINVTLDKQGRIIFLEVPQGVAIHATCPSRNLVGDFQADPSAVSSFIAPCTTFLDLLKVGP